MTDITITNALRVLFKVVQAEGQTDQGVEFVDSYLPRDGRIFVVDSGRIVISEHELDRFITNANELGLQVVDE